jgi:hypothetical protein
MQDLHTDLHQYFQRGLMDFVLILTRKKIYGWCKRAGIFGHNAASIASQMEIRLPAELRNAAG